MAMFRMAGHDVECIGACFCDCIEYSLLECEKSKSFQMLDMT